VSADQTLFFLLQERRLSESMLSTPEVLRRTGGRAVKSIIYDADTIAAKVAELGNAITQAYPDGDLRCWVCSRAASSS
jgi:hypothetical protein